MRDISEKYDIYINLISEELEKTWIWIGVLLFVCIGVIVFFAFWKKNVENRKEKIEWIAALVIFSIVFVIMTASITNSVLNLLYDMTNKAFVVHDSGFSVEVKTEVHRNGPSRTEYYIFFYHSEKEVEILLSERKAEEYGLTTEGEYKNIILVYAERSEKLVDVLKITNENP